MKINKAILVILLLALSYAIDCKNRVLRKKNNSKKLEGPNPNEKAFLDRLQNLRKMLMDKSLLQKDFEKAITEFKKDCDANPLCKGKIITDAQVKQMLEDHENLLVLYKAFQDIDLKLKENKYDEAMQIVTTYFPWIKFHDTELNDIQLNRKKNKKYTIQEVCYMAISEINNQISDIMNDQSKTYDDLMKTKESFLGLGFKQKANFYEQFDPEVNLLIKDFNELFPLHSEEKLILKDLGEFENYRTKMLEKILKESYKYSDWVKEKEKLNKNLKEAIAKYKLLKATDKQKLINEYEEYIVQVEEFMRPKKEEEQDKKKPNNKEEAYCERLSTSISYAIHDFYEKTTKPELTEDDFSNSYNLIKLLTTAESLRKCDRVEIDQRLDEVEQTFKITMGMFEERKIKEKYEEINQTQKKSHAKFFLYNRIMKHEKNPEINPEYIDYAIMLNLPPKFCYKKPDAGYIPKKCPEGYERKGVFCIKSCEAIAQQRSINCKKWKFWGIGCTCNESFSDLQKSFFINYFSKDVLTNFNKGVECDGKKDWKHLALCYQTNCPNFLPGYVNCGMGACAITESVCKWEVGMMFWGTISNLINLLLFVITLGTSSWAKWLGEGLLSPFKNKQIISGSKTLIGIFTQIWRLIAEQDKKTQEAIENEVKEGNSWVGSIWADVERRKVVIRKASNTLMEDFYKNLPEERQRSLADAVEKRFNTLGTQKYNFFEKIKKAGTEYFKECKDFKLDKPDSEMNDIMKDQCMHKLVSMISLFDPTGLVGLFVTFNRPKCPDN